MLRAVIFDFDGVIADDERLHLQGFQHALDAYGITVSEADYFERYLGLDDRDGFAAMLEDGGQAASAEIVGRLIQEKAKAFEQLVRERVTIFPGVRDLVAGFKSDPQPLPLAIASGALRSEIVLVLTITGLRESFDAIVAADDVSRGKPDPETFVAACERLRPLAEGLVPTECLAIEDSHGGLEAATLAGMRTLAVANSYRAGDLSADLVVESLEEVTRDRCAALFDAVDGRSPNRE